LPEITRHLRETIVEAVVEEKDLDLVLLFQHEYTGHAASDTRVKIQATPLGDDDAGSLPRMTIVADRLIIANGVDTKPLEPLTFSAGAAAVHSMSPNQVLTPEWTVRMRFGPDADKPIFVLGSGKTALDAMYALTKRYPDLSHRVQCISGSGTWFMNRDVFFPTTPYQKYAPWTTDKTDLLAEMIERYDGDNARDVYRDMAAEFGAYISPIPNPQTHKAGLASIEEVEHVSRVLSPASEKVHKAYLIDVMEDGPTEVVLKLRQCDGAKTRTEIRVPRSSFIINCTGHLSACYQSPILSCNGKVLAPQSFCGFSGPSANYLTHHFYLGTLEPWWRKHPRWDKFSTKELLAEPGFGLELITTVAITGALVLNRLSPEARQLAERVDTTGWAGMIKLLVAGRRFKAKFPALYSRYCTVIAPHKWGDLVPDEKDAHIAKL
jgi:hypothetical protein